VTGVLDIPRLSCQIAERTIAWKLGKSQSAALQFGKEENVLLCDGKR